MRAAVALVAAALANGATPPQTFRVGVEAVRVDVLVTEGNRPVAGLSASDFALEDSGVPQRIDSVVFEDVPLNVMLVLDTSDSVKGDVLASLKQAAAAVAQLLTPNDRSSLLTFSGHQTLRVPWTSDHSRVERALATTEAGGGTALHDASYSALTARESGTGRALILVFSDGDDTASWLPGQRVIEVARRTEVVVYAVGLRSAGRANPGYHVDFISGLQDGRRIPPELARIPFLQALANETGGRHYANESSQRLRDRFIEIVTEFRSRYLLTYTPRGVDGFGWHPIEVEIKGRRARVTARRGYFR
jgi:VWFA-related protein